MFKIKKGYLSTITCPNTLEKQKCSVLNCVFSHKDPESVPTPSNSQNEDRKRKAETDKGEQTKKKHTSIVQGGSSVIEEKPNLEVKDSKFILPSGINHLYLDRKLRTITTHKIVKYYKDRSNCTPIKSAIGKEYEIAIASKSRNEYDEKVAKFLIPEQSNRKDPKYILPKEIVPTSPATLQIRKKFIQMFVDTIKKVEPNAKTPVLKAIDEEYNVAITATVNTYSTLIKKRIYQLLHPEKFKKEDNTLNEADYLKKLEEIVISESTLTRYGYIMKKPTPVEPDQIKTCRRCNNEFRFEDQLVSTKCHYHSGKTFKNDDNTKIYECCGGIVGGETDTCAFSEHHVFYPKSPEEMEWFSPFQLTEDIFGINKNSFKAVGIDCEMGFTTRGFELLRITAVDFFSGEDVIDLLVKPKGAVIDLNTKWSGISEIKEEALTFEESISLLGEVIDSRTILIGHGLENDMNTMRLIHKRIIDTAILYPKHKTSPTFRFPLKYLTFRYLGRTIQTGQHDSSEDSLAAIDVVKYFINSPEGV